MSDAEAALLTGLERQRRFVLRMDSSRLPCPNCGAQQNVFEAAGIHINDYDFANPPKTFHCMGCKRELRHDVPLFHSGPALWLWGLVPIPTEKTP